MSAAVAVKLETVEQNVTVILKPSFEVTAGVYGLSVAVRAVWSDTKPVAVEPRGSLH